MGYFFWISSFVVAVGIVIGLDTRAKHRAAEADTGFAAAYVASGEVQVEELQVGSTGSALATAAFGLSALQPETFNSQIVRDIIEASPLAYTEKDRLTAKLIAAEMGRAELPRVLTDIRVSLAVE